LFSRERAPRSDAATTAGGSRRHEGRRWPSLSQTPLDLGVCRRLTVTTCCAAGIDPGRWRLRTRETNYEGSADMFIHQSTLPKWSWQ
jgi:hypothetical protein